MSGKNKNSKVGMTQEELKAEMTLSLNIAYGVMDSLSQRIRQLEQDRIKDNLGWDQRLQNIEEHATKLSVRMDGINQRVILGEMVTTAIDYKIPFGKAKLKTPGEKVAEKMVVVCPNRAAVDVHINSTDSFCVDDKRPEHLAFNLRRAIAGAVDTEISKLHITNAKK